MEVIAKKDIKKALKGKKYKTDYITFGNLTLYTKNNTYLGYYKLEDFTDLNGKDISIKSYDVRHSFKSNLNNSYKIEKGDILVCKTNSYKYLVKDGKYRVSEVQNKKIKVEGLKRFIQFNPSNFRKLNKQESRELNINQILNNEENFSVDFTRKFEQFKSKEKELFNILCNAFKDNCRHEISVLDWAIRVTGKKLSLDKKDFEQILDMKISDLLEIIDK